MTTSIAERIKTPANFIDNRPSPATTTHECRNPADPDDLVGLVPEATAAEIDSALNAAVAATVQWQATPAPVRGDLIREWMALIASHAEELASLMTREMGKPLAESRGELGRARMEAEFAAAEGTRLSGATIPSRTPGQLIYTELEPLGVVAAITPWNFPAVAPLRKLAPALVTGNTVVLKPALETSLTALALADLAREAGIPAGVLNVVCGNGATVGDALVNDRRVDAVSFTGSTAVGRSVNLAVAARLGQVQLELGGKNAAFVESADDLDAVIGHITSAAVQAAGQRCTSISRVIVADAIADRFVEAVSTVWDGLVVGDPTDPATQVGPLVSRNQYERVSGYVDLGLSDGAVRTSAVRPVPDGLYYAPTVLDQVTPQMRVAREEIFGPVLTVTRVSDVDEAIHVVNDTDFGLAAVVFTRDMSVAMRFAREARAGMVHVNHGTISQPHVPFGGVKQSGVGAFSIGYTSAAAFTQTKTVYLAPGL
ncbi:aldehyde dehydrogenase family protein [Mycobacterium sp. 4D054]|uniref:aldehyde dehydrogenase family protein n=1 Tax=Mycobacterium sp. 4D054 TaxID=3457440 RepID=UPI003FD40C57